MNVSYINAFLKATYTTFQTLMKIDLVLGKPHIKETIPVRSGVSGVIGLSGKAQGFIALSYSKPIAVKFISLMVGAPINDFNQEVVDGIGEITNIVAGYSKQFLTELNLTISLPNVISGDEFLLVGPSCVPVIVVPLSCTEGEFTIEVSLRE